jgi:hypothetical protein
MILGTLQNQTLRRGFALLITGCVSATLFLVLAAGASAEAADSSASAPPATAAVSVPVEQISEAAVSAVPVEDAEAPIPSAEPGETREATSSTQTTVTSVVDDTVASAASNPPLSSPPVGGGVRSAATVVDSVSTAATSVAPAGGEPETTIVSAATRHVAPLAEGIRRDSSEAIASVRQVPAETISVLTNRLPAGPAGSLPLLNLPSPATAEAMLPPAGIFQTGGESSKDGPFNFPGSLQTSFFSQWSPIVSPGYATEYLTLSKFASVGTAGPALQHLGRQGRVLLAAASSSVGATLASAAAHGPGSPAPMNIPLPAPGSPGVIAPSSGDTFFVPFAALLALLALVAPASTRRLREAPDFRAPTPFVCALERPG